VVNNILGLDKEKTAERSIHVCGLCNVLVNLYRSRNVLTTKLAAKTAMTNSSIDEINVKNNTQKDSCRRQSCTSKTAKKSMYQYGV